MKKWIAILLLMLPFWACVGQKEDPEPDPDPIGPEKPTGQEEGSVFFHRVLALGFTATWCQYCPDMATALSEAARERPGRVVTLAVHYADELSPAEADKLVETFGIYGYPSLVFDYDRGTSCSGRPAETLMAYVDQAVEKEACGLAAESVTEDGALRVMVTVKAVRPASYSLCAALAEDGIQVANQAGYGPGYTCNAVLRGYLAPGIDGVSLGELQAGEEGQAQFSMAAPEAPENKYLVLYVLEDGVAVNALRLGLDEKTGYTYEKED